MTKICLILLSVFSYSILQSYNEQYIYESIITRIINDRAQQQLIILVKQLASLFVTNPNYC